MLEEKYKTVVLSIHKTKQHQSPSSSTIQAAAMGESRDPEGSHRRLHKLTTRPTTNTTRTVTLEQVTRTMALETANGRLRVGILLYRDVNVLDYSGPLHVFSSTRRATGTEDSDDESSLFQILLIGETLDSVTTQGGMEVIPHVDFDSCPELDIFLVPGGASLDSWKLRYHIPTINFIRAQGIECKLLAAVSSGVLLAAHAGLLDNRHVATHSSVLNQLETDFGHILTVERDLQWVQHGKIFTSADGLDISLKIVQQIYGKRVARATARCMEHPFPDSNQRKEVYGDDDDDCERGYSHCAWKCSIM
jgi:transcriptional regulator GlxA family with amidase domain